MQEFESPSRKFIHSVEPARGKQVSRNKSTTSSILQLQKQIGNRAVQNLISRQMTPNYGIMQLSKKISIDGLNKSNQADPNYEFDEIELQNLFDENKEAALEEAAKIILRSQNHDTMLVNEIKHHLTDLDVKNLIEGKPIKNKALNSKLRIPKRMSLLRDDLLLRPWLRDMYGIHDKKDKDSRLPNHSVLSLGTTVPESNNLKKELNVSNLVHVDKKTKNKHNDALEAIKNCLNNIAGDMSVTICGHIAYNDSENPNEWTLAGLSLPEILEAMDEAITRNTDKPYRVFKQLNLLSCGSELFAEALYTQLAEMKIAPMIMTAVKDEIPITPGPKGAQEFQYLFSGDYTNEEKNQEKNISSSILKLERNSTNGTFTKSTLHNHARDTILEIFQKQSKVADTIIRYLLPTPPTEEELDEVRHN